jgi:hypothetical protein
MASRALILLLSAACAGCGGTSVIPVARMPDSSLLLPCDPPAPPSGERPTDTGIALAWIDAVQKYLACAARHDALAAFVRGGKP